MWHLAGLLPWAGGGGEVVSRLGMVGPRGSRVVSPLGDCDSGGGLLLKPAIMLSP